MVTENRTMVNSVSVLVMGIHTKFTSYRLTRFVRTCFQKEHLSETIEGLQTVTILTIVTCVKKKTKTALLYFIPCYCLPVLLK